ncbi:hypothetical protein HF072_07450 [Bacillus sp. RO3]|nr:hypothetical protein [Bacillus sp. RO3]
MAVNIINVPLGPGEVEFGKTSPEVIDKTKGGINFKANHTKKDITIDQFGDTPVKSVLKGGTCQATVPMATYELDKLSKFIPNSKFGKDETDPQNVKKRLNVYANAGYDLLQKADKLVLKPLDPDATPNDYITIPNAVPMPEIDWTYDSDNERIAMVTFIGYPDADGLLYFLGDEAVTI